MKPYQIALALFFTTVTAFAQGNPQLSSWFTANSGKYARIYASAADETAGTKSLTWSRGTTTQALPTYSGVTEINYSPNWIYIRTTGLASYTMGPWPTNFPSFPTNTATIYRIPRVPTIPGTKTGTGLGATGRMVNGVAIYDSRDAFSYSTANAADARPNTAFTGDGIWNRDGDHNEGPTFDPAGAHQASNTYHNHGQPIGLRYQLGDHVDYNATTNRYTESTAPVTQHSPIVGWAQDGLPVYGPYGYSDPDSAASGVRRMISGFALRDGSNGTTAITVREALPAWAQRVQNKPTLTSAQYGPAVNATYLLGHYIEDFDYQGDLAGRVQTKGSNSVGGFVLGNYDLNEYNVRFCVTPEFPSGTWAYFTTINADNTPAFPYTTGRQFYGNATGGASNEATMNADTPLTRHFTGGANTAITVNASVSTPNVTLTWSAVEGGTYSADASLNQTAWTAKASGIVASSTSATTTYATLASTGTEYARVNRTALATFDSAGQSAVTVAQTGMTSFLLTGTAVAPTVTTPTSASITGGSAVLGGNITADGGALVSTSGIVVALTSVNSDPIIGGTGVTNITGSATLGVFTVNATGLATNSAYTFKAYATNSVGTTYSTTGSFSTLTANLPTITSATVTNILNSSAVLGGNVTADGGATITARGVVWALNGTNSNPTIGGTGVTNVVGTGTTGVFTVNATGFTTPAPQTIAFRAYATNASGTVYTTPATVFQTVTLSSLSNLVLSAGTLSPTFASNTLAYTVSVPNSVSSITVTPSMVSGTATVTVNTVAVTPGTASGPITLNVGSNTITVVGTQTTPPSTRTYTVTVTRAAPSAPLITTPTSASIAATSATLGGNVTSDGGQAITARGVVLAPTATNSNPQIGGSGVTNVVGTGTTGVFTVNATGLSAGTAYSFAAYATNSLGITYTTPAATFSTVSLSGDLSNLTISAGTLAPTFSSATTSYTASVGNAVSSLNVTPTALIGTSTITVNSVPVSSGSPIAVALNIGSNPIDIVVTGLDSTVKTYSMVVTRASGTPIVTSPTATGLSTTTATLGGNVTNDGGTAITARGIVLAPTATNSNPQLGGSGVTNFTASGTTGIFTVSATGLTLGVNYTFAAYATNSAGTSYSVTGTFTTPRNNILLIIADDFGLDACKLYNPAGNNAATPNIDSLATNGVRFNNAYAYTVCSPTRSSIITGRYGFRTGTGDVVTPNSGSPLQASEFTLPDAFAANAAFNYQLKHLGKYHLINGSSTAAQMSPVTVAGWPSYAGPLSAEVADYYNWTKVVTDGTAGGTSSTAGITTYATTDTVNDAIAFINTQTTAGKPWFSWVALNAPHFPFHKPPTSLLTTQAYIDLSGTAGDITANRLSYYNAAVQAMDTEIGRLLASVDLNVTTVIFIGDNGTDTQVAQSPYSSSKSKGSLYEGGVRVPLIIRGPNVISPGRTTDTLVHSVDLYSTILELAGINVATTTAGVTLDSQSLLPVLQNQTVTRPFAYSELFDTATPTSGGEELRDSRYKVIRFNTGTAEFYDLQVDPYEAVNLIAGGVGSMTPTQQTAYYQLLADLGTYSTTAPTTINSVTLNPTTPTNNDSVDVTANVTPATGATLSSVVLNYSTGAATTTTVFTETMGTAAAAFTTATNTGTNNAWTVASAVGPPNPFSFTTTANHGTGNAYGLEMNRGTPNLADNHITTTNNIDASTGASAYVEFWVATANLGATNGWAFQTSTNGTTWTTRTTTPAYVAGTNLSYTLYHYDLTAGERVSTLKLRFQFAGNGATNPASKISLDDIKVVTTSTAAPAPITMTSVGGGNYTGTIPAQAAATTVSYNVIATDSTSGIDYNASSYTVIAGSPVLAVTPATALNSSGTAGSGSYSPASQIYTLSNTGTGSLSWTAAKTQTWLNLSATSGTLAAGASTTVTASINTANANALAVGTFNDTISFTNTSNNSGNTTRSASLIIGSITVPGTPAITALPAYSQGTARTVRWPAIAGATSYTLEISTTSNFATVLSSQTLTTPTGSFSNLAHGITYYYRVLATNGVGSSSYSSVVSSTQDNVSPIVAITSPSSTQSTATNTITLSGTSSDALSGISKVTVNGATATTGNNFATWTITVPLGFGTNSLTALAIDNAGNTTSSTPLLVTLTTAQTFNPLIIPDIITGTTFNLALKPNSKQFLAGAATNTNAYNDMPFGAPTLIMNKGDWVQMHVTNNLPVDTTTTHWHGFHIPAIMDGGPHQVIPAGTTWSPSWLVDNNAGTYWFHPHLHEKTQEQISRGGVGMIIIRDPIESALTLPRTYGVDDIPLALGSRRFTTNQIVTAASAYGDVMLVNGVISPQVSLPKQYVRLRILNAEIERSLNLGFSDNRTFWVIATDGGLVDAPVATTRVVMHVGERYEILVDLTNDTLGGTLDLRCFNNSASLGTPLSNSYAGGEPQTTGQFGSLLNNLDFNVLRINIAAQTASPVLTRPTTLTTNALWTNGDVTNPTTRTLAITGGAPGIFFFDGDDLFSPTVFNHTINLNAVERWTITNTSGFSHSFHIHDIQFNLISRVSANGSNPASVTGIASYEVGWKDTLYVQRNSSVTFLAKFDHFASNTNPFMYHCHFANHEDEGLMGQFVVVNNQVEDLAVASFTRYGNNNLISLDFKATPGTTYTLQWSPDLSTWTDVGSVTSDGNTANFTETDQTRLSGSKGFYRVTIPTVP
ncbi:MAG: sulfatase-like hydrolase/transferase [Prosthecobacter sp.]|uniref:sulfatase-like hydrolase/transferase n=1 Tax=Prosthecobacter sp. TaxID=1965333 RepID=UPI0038FDFDB5